MIQNNPDMVRNMMINQMESNPALRQMMEQNPSIRHMLYDPQQFADMMNMISNPQAMQQMMRSQDLALSQIENMPGGFAALSNMYETIQRPLEESSNYSNDSNSSSNTSGGNRSSVTNDGATGTAMPNPWGNSNPRAASTASGNTASTASPSNPFMMNPSQQQLDPMNMMNMMMNSNNNSNSNPFLGAGSSNGAPSLDQRQAALQMLQNNPSISNMMNETIRTNPALFRQMMMQQMQGMDNTNPYATAMIQNMSDEQFVQMFTSMMDPTNMNQILQMEQQMQGLHLPSTNNNSSGSNPAALLNPWLQQMANNPNATSMQNNPFGLNFSNLLSGTGAGNATANVNNISPWGSSGSSSSNAAVHQSPPPGELYRLQLQSLYDMGFDDEIRNVAALQMTQGNVNRSVDMLLSGTVPHHAIQAATVALASNSSSSSSSSSTSTHTPASTTTATSDATTAVNLAPSNDATATTTTTADGGSNSTTTTPEASASSTTTTQDAQGDDTNATKADQKDDTKSE
jgi:ubiquilin